MARIDKEGGPSLLMAMFEEADMREGPPWGRTKTGLKEHAEGMVRNKKEKQITDQDRARYIPWGKK